LVGIVMRGGELRNDSNNDEKTQDNNKKTWDMIATRCGTIVTRHGTIATREMCNSKEREVIAKQNLLTIASNSS